jgi:hypothetical protein
MSIAAKRSSHAVLLSLRLVRCGGIIAVRYGDWRRPIAALLGRFLPKLRAARKGGLFLS